MKSPWFPTVVQRSIGLKRKKPNATSNSCTNIYDSQSNSDTDTPTSSPHSSTNFLIETPSEIVSSGVKFQPPSKHYWKINREWYDFEPFFDRHPGGKNILLLARDRFNDCTYAFEAHHINHMKVRKIIQKYKVPKEELHLCPPIKLSESPKFIPLDSFYSVLRNRVKDYLHENKLKQGPNMMTLVSFWITLAIWIGSIALTLKYQTVPFAIFQGFCGAILGAYGHNFIHQPGYMNYARISLDTIGFSSQGWYREHVLQHHMYTNTPLDNHFHGMKPFIQTDPTVNRNLFEKICALGNPIVLWFGLPGNYVIHLLEMMRGREDITLGKAFLPGLIYLFCKVCGWKRGCMLMFVQAGFLGVHYFTMALMNHNAEHCVNTEARNGANDWGVAQLHSCADWGLGRHFLLSFPYLWLNYHTVHHLFPQTDFSHHPAIQKLLVKTCEEFGVEYKTGKFMTLYKEMVGTFMSPMSLASEVNCYNSHL